MKKSIYLLFSTFIILTSCSNNPWRGKKYYLITCELKGYIASLHEVELHFISDNTLEAKRTLFSQFGELMTYKNDSSINKTSRIINYNYSNGILSIPDLNMHVSFTKDDSTGELKSNTNEIFYKTSIVEIIETEEAKERVRKASQLPSLAQIYIDMLKPAKKN
ncbi:hypothetical protein [Pseudopedobacter beijingensis]|uniref:Lipopolysaccharide-assembly n=1 Tax=Pseudopedobacter beijingensis TaxID=1207056 RepID=A0ABW4IGC3_9SPHI